MGTQYTRPFSRRRFLGGVMLAGTAGLFGLHPRPVAAEPPPETTTLRLMEGVVPVALCAICILMAYGHPYKEPDDMEAMMNIQTPALSTNPQLDHLAGQFEHWRRNRSHPSERIPQALWDQAAVLATAIPYSRVAKQLRLAPSDLKKQMATKDLTCQAPVPPLSFIEVPAASQQPASDPETEIELERADGARLRLRSGNATLSLAALVRAFLEAH